MTVNEKKNKKEKNKGEDEKETEKMFLKRPVIFICNDPYAKGMK